MPASECGLPFSTGGLVGEYGQWTVPSYTNEQIISGSAGKRAVVRAGGSASRAAGDQSSTDPGGGFCRNKQRKSNWRLPTEHSKRGHWVADSQEFPSLETLPRTVGDTKRSPGISATEVDRRPTASPTPVPRNVDRGMRPAQDFQTVPQKDSNTRTRGVQKTIVTPLSALAENFIPRKTSRKPPTPKVPTDNELDRSFARTGPGKIETPQDMIEIDIATVGAAYPNGISKPVAMADVAGASGPAVTGAGGPVVVGTRFLAVAEVYAPFKEAEGDPQGDDRKVDQKFSTPEEDAGSRPLEHSGVKEGGRPRDGLTEFDRTAPEAEIVSHPLEHSGVVEWAGVSDGLRERSPPEMVCAKPGTTKVVRGHRALPRGTTQDEGFRPTGRGGTGCHLGRCGR